MDWLFLSLSFTLQETLQPPLSRSPHTPPTSWLEEVPPPSLPPGLFEPETPVPRSAFSSSFTLLLLNYSCCFFLMSSIWLFTCILATRCWLWLKSQTLHTWDPLFPKSCGSLMTPVWRKHCVSSSGMERKGGVFPVVSLCLPYKLSLCGDKCHYNLCLTGTSLHFHLKQGGHSEY